MGTLNGARAVAKRSTTDIEEDWVEVEVESPPRRVGAVEEVERGGVKV